MLDFFKPKKENTPQDVKSIREGLLQFVKQQLQRAEGGEGANIRGIYLFIHSNDEDKHLYEAAVYIEEENRFKDEIQKIADDYAIGLPPGWTLEITFTHELPAQAVRSGSVQAGVILSTGKKVAAYKKAKACIKVLNGQAEQESYTISSETGKVNIGRDKNIQTADGFYRINTISFPAESVDQSNRYISRQHAHIEWDGESGVFLLFADEGGVPPRNKIKVRTVDGNIIKLGTTHFAHQLSEGDQIILGESALLQFTYEAEN
ncbi:MAG TPA: FHA domain-containing protein [Chitinophagaceae bacterium]|nr:FHA domain-containing protein [Chitinophagaceae bacterium]